MSELVMTEQILDHGSLSGHAPRGCGVCRPQEASSALRQPLPGVWGGKGKGCPRGMASPRVRG